MYKKMLFPVDGSEVSNHAVEEGFRLAFALGSEAVLLYVVDISIVSTPDAESGLANIELVRQSFRAHGEKLLAGLSAAAKEKGIKAETLITEGDVHDEIIRTAGEKDADLIIIGTHGRRGLNRLLLGSVAESVARRAHCPVLLVRPV